MEPEFHLGPPHRITLNILLWDLPFLSYPSPPPAACRSPAEVEHTFPTQSPSAGPLGSSKRRTRFCTKGGLERRPGARGALSGRDEGVSWSPTPARPRCHFLGGPFPRFQAPKGTATRCGPHSHPTTSRSPVPGPRSPEGPRCLLPRAAPSARRRCARPPAQPGGCEHLADCGPREPGGQLRACCHLCARGRRERPRAARGGAAGRALAGPHSSAAKA